VFQTNTFFIPITDTRLQKNPSLVISAFVITNRIDQLTEAEIYGQAKLLGTCELPITPMLGELLDVQGLGLRRKVEFKRMSSNPNDKEPKTVGRASAKIKMMGDYITKFDGPADGIMGGPKKATGEMHVLPIDDHSFKWRIRVDLRAGENMPLNDVVAQGLPSCFVEYGWSFSSLSANAGNALLASNETEQSVLVDKSINPNWNQQILFNNPKNVLDFRSGYFVIQLKDFYRETMID
jgi:hypothetical protein